MAILLTAQGLHASFGARPLFEDVSFTVEEGDRIGLIGPNGAGKSTLLRLLASTTEGEASRSGTVSKRRGLRVGFLEQSPVFPPDATIETVIAEAVPPEDWERAAAAEVMLAKLSLAGDQPGIGPTTPVASLSGGWRKRLALARELARQPDLLLLDEPTNHLDVESIEWLERLLSRSRFATITVTHDRFFLQRAANRIVELDCRNAGGLLSVAGDFSHYLRVKAETMHAQERREIVLRNTLRRETEWLRRGPAARTTKQEARIARAGELAADVAELSTRNVKRTTTIDLQSSGRQPKRLIEAKGLAKQYGDRTIFSGVDLFVGPGTRLGLLGPNGCGKSTLLRVLLGEEAPSAGTVQRADGLAVASSPRGARRWDPELTLANTVCPDGDFVSYRGARVHVRGYLERFLFAPEQADMAVGKLSGGEQSRLLIAELDAARGTGSGPRRADQRSRSRHPRRARGRPHRVSRGGFAGVPRSRLHRSRRHVAAGLRFAGRHGRSLCRSHAVEAWRDANPADSGSSKAPRAVAARARAPKRPRDPAPAVGGSATSSNANTKASKPKSPLPRRPWRQPCRRASTRRTPATRLDSWSSWLPSKAKRGRWIASTHAGRSWKKRRNDAWEEARLAETSPSREGPGTLRGFPAR